MSRRTQKNVGIIGLGIIGSRVADNLRRRGFHVFVWNRTPRPYPNFVGSASEVADLCDFVQIFVSDDDALMDIVQQMRRSLSPHHVIMAHSTVAPHTMRAAAEVVQRRGAHFLDAPFTGSKLAAEKGELVYYVAGDAAAFRRARPALEASSKEIIEIGEIGQATTIKLATNMVTAASVHATAEALALVHSSGLSVEKFAAAMRGNASTSATVAMKLPKMMDGDFEPHFSVKHMLKDVQIAARLGRSHGLSFGATEAARDSLRREAEQGRGDLDYSSMSRAFFPDRAPLQPAEDPAADEEQTFDLVDSPTAEPAERDSNGSGAEAVADEKDPPEDDTAAGGAEAAAAEQEIGADKSNEQPEESPSEPTAAAAAEVSHEGERGAESTAADEPLAESEAEEGANVAAAADPVEGPEESDASNAEEKPASGIKGDPDELKPAAAEAPAADTPKQDYRLDAMPGEDARAAEPVATSGKAESREDEAPAEERRGFFGRMFGRTGGD